MGLSELNRANPQNLADNLRALKLSNGESMGIGTYLNVLAAQANQKVASTAAAATVTIAAPAAGDQVLIDVGTASFAYTLSAGDAASATAAATAVRTALNANAAMALILLASNAAGVITLTALKKGVGFNDKVLRAQKYGVGSTTVTPQAATFGAATAGTGADDALPIVD
jgi:hypothetical protein